MAWKDMSTMSQRWKFVVLASAKGANVSELCRRFGVSRKTGYRWLSRYAAERSAQRVFTSVQRYLMQRLKLVINEPKSRVRPACGCEFLGFADTGRRVTITVSPKKLTNFKRRVKEHTGRSRGVSMACRLFASIATCEVGLATSVWLASSSTWTVGFAAVFGCASGNCGDIPTRSCKTSCVWA